MSGVSIGAINAAVLCGCRHGDPKRALRELWADLTTVSLPSQWPAINENMSVFGNPGMYRLRTDYYNFMGWTSFYDTTPLNETLARSVDFAKLGPANFRQPSKKQAPRLILTATNLLTGRLERFDSKDMQIEPAHVRASGSLPPSFPATSAPSQDTGEEAYYWDGGLFDNTPLSKVMDALQESDDRDKTMYVVTLFPKCRAAAGQYSRGCCADGLDCIQQQVREGSAARAPNHEPDSVQAGARSSPDAARGAATAAGPSWLRDVEGICGPINIVEISNLDAHGASDFSALGISGRRKAGYEAAASKLAELR